jgi:hypothetical protein
LIALGIVSAMPTGPLNLMGGGVRLLASLALALLGVVWVIGLELFLRFFDRYLSRNNRFATWHSEERWRS